jgi:predicted TIM-barrel fold metal-dependent hydrolase
MDRDGVERHACQPTVIGFAGTKLLDLADRDLALACVRAYNDFVIDEWCGVAPDRFISIVLAPMWDADLARDEVRRAIAKGAQAVAFVEDPTALGLPSYHSGYWNPMLAAIHEAGIPLCLHMNSPMVRMVQGADTPWGVHLTLMYCTSMATMVNLLFSPVFADFPRLKVVLPEGGLGWVPFMLEKADFLWDRHRGYCRGPATPAAPPSELYQGRIFSCIQSHDQAGIRERHAIGVEQILWQSDYPHADSTWPRSAELMVAQLGGVPAAEQELILGGNARRVFNLES